MITTYHFHPEIMNLLVDTLPLLFRSKDNLLLFFRGAGVTPNLVADLTLRVQTDRTNITKYEIARTILSRINDHGDAMLSTRREVIKRVVEFEDFSTCWPDDQLKAKGLLSEVRRVVNVKDSFTRMTLERESERKAAQSDHAAKVARQQKAKGNLEAIKRDLFALFKMTNAQARGKALEGVLNRLFGAYDILVREAFTVRSENGQTIVEQIDGAIEIDGSIYLVEMKWRSQPLGVGDVSQHLVRVFFRGQTRGIFISASGYTEPAVRSCKEALQKAVVVLCDLSESSLRLLEVEGDLKAKLKEKINAAILEKDPFRQFSA